MHNNLKLYLVLLLSLSQRIPQTILQRDGSSVAFSIQVIQGKRKFFCQILYAMQMTGSGSSKQTERKPRAD